MTPEERKIRETIDEFLTPDGETIFAPLYGPPPIDRSKRERLIFQCCFYKGESMCPYDGEDSMRCCYWDYERVWVEWELNDSPELESGLAYLERFCPYAAKDNPDVPLGLQAIFASRIERGGDVTRMSLRNFIKRYKQVAKG